jgi:hypothetical protein
MQLPTTLPTFDELLGRDAINESNIAEALFRLSLKESATPHESLQVFTLHAELEGMRLLGAFESLLLKWQAAGAHIVTMAKIRTLALPKALPDQVVARGEVPGRSGLLAVQPSGAVLG